MSIAASLFLAALLPTASVNEIPPQVLGEAPISCAVAAERQANNLGTRFFFKLQGTVTAELGNRFVLDDGSASGLIIRSCDGPVRRGDRITAVCTCLQPERRSYLIAEALEVKTLASDTLLPPVTEVLPIDLLNDDHSLHEVFLRGTVTDAFHDEIDRNWDVLVVEAAGAKTMVWMPATSQSIRQINGLIDAEIRVRGVCFTGGDSTRQFLPCLVQVASPEAIRVTLPPPADPFASPGTGDHRRVLTGTVLVDWNDCSTFILTPDGERIEVRLAAGQRQPPVGSLVTAAGFIRRNAYYRRLVNALIRIDGTSRVMPEPPLDITASAVLDNASGRLKINSHLHGKTVRLSGTVRLVNSTGTPQAQLQVESDGMLVPVWIGPDTPVPPVNSSISAVGVCIITTDSDDDLAPYGRLNGFSVALRSASELTVTARPPWWTPGKLLLVIGALLGLLVAILIWNASLRIIAERRSRELLRADIGRIEATLRTEERTRLSVELHDTIAQSLTGITFEVNAANRLMEDSPEKASIRLAQADRALKSCRDELRNCIWDLRSNALEQRNLDEAIRQTVKPHVGTVRLVIRFNVIRSRLSDSATHALLRIIRELAINATRHGKATTVQIAGCIENGALLFSVRDDGCGFNPSDALGVSDGHFGLQGIRERINRFNGTMEINSAPGFGTRVSASIRLPKDRTVEMKDNA